MQIVPCPCEPYSFHNGVSCTTPLQIGTVPNQGTLITCTYHPTFSGQSQPGALFIVISSQSSSSIYPAHWVIFILTPLLPVVLVVPLLFPEWSPLPGEGLNYFCLQRSVLSTGQGLYWSQTMVITSLTDITCPKMLWKPNTTHISYRHILSLL